MTKTKDKDKKEKTKKKPKKNKYGLSDEEIKVITESIDTQQETREALRSGLIVAVITLFLVVIFNPMGGVIVKMILIGVAFFYGFITEIERYKEKLIKQYKLEKYGPDYIQKEQKYKNNNLEQKLREKLEHKKSLKIETRIQENKIGSITCICKQKFDENTILEHIMNTGCLDAHPNFTLKKLNPGDAVLHFEVDVSAK